MTHLPLLSCAKICSTFLSFSRAIGVEFDADILVGWRSSWFWEGGENESGGVWTRMLLPSQQRKSAVEKFALFDTSCMEIDYSCNVLFVIKDHQPLLFLPFFSCFLPLAGPA